MPAVIAALDKQLLLFEAKGDRGGVEAWFAKYDVMPQPLTRALESTREIPIDITPVFALSSEARP